MAQAYKFTSHEAFSHDSIDALGYDWRRIANPHIEPRYPFKVYFPTTTEDIAAAVREARAIGQVLLIRSKGHSSNDLVLADRGCILCTEKLNKIIAFDDSAGTLKVQAGCVLADLDEYLRPRNFGLPIIGDHNHITAGGFASVGGISPASHRFGMFIDNVRSLEFVTPEGEIQTCGRDQSPEIFYGLLGGTGRRGIIATLTLDVIQIDKYGVVLQNERNLYADVEAFLGDASRLISVPGDARMERGLWIEYPVLGRIVGVGQFSSYHQTSQSLVKSLRNTVEYGYLHFLGYWAGRLPNRIDVLWKYLGFAGIVLSPRYATVKNVEGFTDRVIDSCVGDPTRMFIALAPVSKFPVLFRKLLQLFRDFRNQTECFTYISVYVKAIHSKYLSSAGHEDAHSELMFYTGIRPERLTPHVLEDLVSRMDDICIEYGAFRYMHSRTVKDAERRNRIDPNIVRQQQAPARATATPTVKSANGSTAAS